MQRILDLRPTACAPSRSARARLVLTLEVRHGAPRLVGERISSRRLLIGSDRACDVRLDPAEGAELHALAHVDRDGAWIEAVVNDPPLSVNGEPVEWARLCDGDVVRIGSFECVARIGASAGQLGRSEERSAAHRGRGFSDDDAECLDAAALVERIEAEEDVIDRFDAALNLGLRALVQAARRTAEGSEMVADEPGDADGPAVVRWDAGRGEPANPWTTAGIPSLVRHLGQLVESLRIRIETIDGEIPEAAEEALVRAAHELQVLNDRLADPAHSTREESHERIAA